LFGDGFTGGLGSEMIYDRLEMGASRDEGVVRDAEWPRNSSKAEKVSSDPMPTR
jgi:hypothetical protein